MELYKNIVIRSRIKVLVPNPIIQEGEMAKYNELCETVEKHDVKYLRITEFKLEFELKGRHGKIEKKSKLNSKSNLALVIQRIEDADAERAYLDNASDMGTHVMNQKRSSALINSFAYALNEPDAILTGDDNLNVTVAIKGRFKYNFNLNNLAIKQRKKADDLIRAKRVAEVLKKYKPNK